MSAETDQALVRRFYEEVLSSRKTDALGEIFTDDYVCHSSNVPAALPPGNEGTKQFVTEFLSGYPQLQFTVEKQTSDGDKVHSQISAKSAFPVGPVMTIPANPSDVAASDTLKGTSTDRIVHGRIAESWIEFELPSALPQLEEMPGTEQKS